LSVAERPGPVLELRGLTKRYGRTVALDGIDLSLDAGEVVGLLGPNGAGKTTAVKIILGLTHASGGGGALLGRPFGDPRARRQVGYLPELFRFQGWLSAREVLRLHLELAGYPASAWEGQIAAALAAAELVERADDRVATYSKGMQQRLGLAAALLGEPAFVVLDEPGTALDPIGRHALRATIRALRDRGTTVLVNSHQLTEVEQVCDRVAILDRGRLQAFGPLADLLSSGGVRVRASGVDAALRARLASYGEVVEAGAWMMIRGASEQQVPLIVETLVQAGARVYGIEPMQPSLEERFIQLLEVHDA
jgi:ABC-2 type transport system ATP-binding protein